MTFYDTALVCALVFGTCAFFTPTWDLTWQTLHKMGALDDGWPLLKTAAVGAGLGVISALVSPNVETAAHGVATAAISAAFTVHGRMFYLAMRALMKSPEAWEAYRTLVIAMRSIAEQQLNESLNNPTKLQAYLDKTYGKGVVDCQAPHRRQAKTSSNHAAH